MTRLEDLQPTAAVRGILPDQVVTVVSVQWFGSEALELTYKGPSGRLPTSSNAMTSRAYWSTEVRKRCMSNRGTIYFQYVFGGNT